MKLSENFKWELPYNFDTKLIDELLVSPNFSIIKERTDFIYFPCYWEDGNNTRQEIPLCRLLAPKTRDEYVNHINQIQNRLGIPVAVLFQRNKKNTQDSIPFYLRNGVRYFIVSDVSLARKIKELNPDATTICSITRKLTYQDILTKDLSMFDRIVLDFPFQRGLNHVKQLPKTHQYSIIVNNTSCFVDCVQYSHWFEGQSTCRFFHNVNCGQDRALNLSYADYNQFDGYVSHLKLQGRQDATKYLLISIEKLLIDDNKSAHTESWLNYSENLGLFNGTYKRKIQVLNRIANQSLNNFSFEIGADSKYSWTEGKDYTIVIDETYGILYISSDNGVLKTYFPLYFDVGIFLNKMFNLIIDNDDIIPESFHMSDKEEKS